MDAPRAQARLGTTQRATRSCESLEGQAKQPSASVRGPHMAQSAVRVKTELSKHSSKLEVRGAHRKERVVRRTRLLKHRFTRSVQE